MNRISDLSFLHFTPNLEALDLASNFATTYVFPEGVTNLYWLNLGENRLTNVVFAPDMTNLLILWLDDNKFSSAPWLGHLTGLQLLDLGINQLSELTIPHTVTNIVILQLRLNPLNTLILSDVLATNHLSETVQSLRDAGVIVHVYPLAPSLKIRKAEFGDMLRIELRGPPGIHDVLRSEDTFNWIMETKLTNVVGEAGWSVVPFGTNSFYRTRLP
ncbi:MAG: hypothetical protein IH623_29920 [Verrucomicrobia bacterium]|nr:hypothetical protein [Verrucomicrobiota bacterium]